MGVSRERLRNLEHLIASSRVRPPDVDALALTFRGDEGGGGKNSPTLIAFSPLPAQPHTVTLELGPTVAAAVHASATGAAPETCIFGPRGERKTWGALTAMLQHAWLHHQAGHPLPTKWVGVADTFQSHRIKTVRSLEDPRWRGLWRLRQDDHLAVATIGGTELVHLDLFGIEDQGAMDRLRMEMHGLWFEEPAPSAVLVQSSGISEDAWMLGLTSLRLASHCHPALITSNYPDEDHWTWQRFVVRQHPGSAYFRIPPGESASAEQREEWARALEGRPDLLRRLLAGEPGAIAMGPQVAVGWNSEAHVAREPLVVVRSEVLWMGHDAGHTPTTVIGQPVDGHVHIFAGLVTERAGTKQHLEQTVLPWLARYAPWILRGGEAIYHVYDPNMDTGEQADIDQSPVERLKESLGGVFIPGATSWPGRRDPLLALFNRAVAGRPMLQVSPTADTELLRKALAGRWYYKQTVTGEVLKDLPEKNHPWSDLGDAFCYLIGGIAPSREWDAAPTPRYATSHWNPHAPLPSSDRLRSPR